MGSRVCYLHSGGIFLLRRRRLASLFLGLVLPSGGCAATPGPSARGEEAARPTSEPSAAQPRSVASAREFPPKTSPTPPLLSSNPAARAPERGAAVEPSSGSSSEEPVRGQPPGGSPFAPKDPGPMFDRSAHEGDGVFRDFFSKHFDPQWADRATKGTPEDYGHAWVRRIVLHPHPASRFQTLVLAAFDLERVGVAHVAGASDVVDVGRKDLASEAGLVPAALQQSLLAVFNGGFQPRHGRWGMLSLGKQLLIPPREDACTVAILADGTVAIAPWPELAQRLSEIVAYRQTPPCLVSGGKIHPQLERGKRGAWAGQRSDRKTRRRSVIGVSSDGRTLFVGLGSETEPETLAAGVLFAGAASAAQLDINWNWTRLFLFESKEKAPTSETKGDEAPRPVVRGALVSDMVKDQGEYVTRPAGRGFFYVYRRDD